MEATANVMTESSFSEMEVQRKMEDEHLHLQRQVRMIQVDRENRTVGVHPMFRRQDEHLRVLKKEYENHLKDLQIAKSGAHKKKDKKMKVDLEKALLLMMKSEKDCEAGLTMMQQMDRVLQMNTKNILHLRSLVMANRGQMKERRQQSQKRLMSTENKLEKAMLRFNTIQCENKKIREEIDHMLKERAIFNRDWSKMLNALKKGKKFLSDLFESSTVAYDQRDEWCMKLKSVQEKGKMDQKMQIQEMKDLQKTIDHDMKLHHFLHKKSLIRVNNKQKEREEEQKRQEMERIKNELNAYRKILNDLTEYTQETSVDKIIEQFDKTEQENMSVYKLVNECCAENEVLTRDLKSIRQRINDQKDRNEMMEDKRQIKLQDLRKTLTMTLERTAKIREKCQEREMLQIGAMEKVEEIFKMLGCSTEPFLNLLGDKQPSLNQLGLTMYLITEKIKELVHVTYYYERSIQRKEKSCISGSRLKKYTVHVEPCVPRTSTPMNVMVPAEPCPSCVEARWMSRVSEVQEMPFNKQMTLAALAELASDSAYERYDRVHALADCRLPHSRSVLARRYL